ncbi:MAG: class I SAM-dependent methyltransferase [Bacteroidota bacterium]
MECKSCNSKAVVSKIDFGKQPPSNRYQVTYDADQESHSLELGICNSCGLLQLIDPMPIEMVRSRFSWIRYNEPEFHLDDLVEKLVRLPGIDTKSKIAGLTYKDESTLDRIEKKGFKNIGHAPNFEKRSGEDQFDGLETIQQIITEGNEQSLDADLLIVRHVLEHAHDMRKFLTRITKQVKTDGYLIFEIPDSSKFLAKNNYSFMWEEHIVYFTEHTLRYFFENQGHKVIHIYRYEAPLEDSLVAVIAIHDNIVTVDNEVDITDEIAAVDTFSNNFDATKRVHLDFFKANTEAGKKIAVFGAGHLAVKYINLFGLQEYISYVIDDSKDKEDLFMPGSSIQIKGSSFLSETDICILVLNPESQVKVMGLKKDMIKDGGKFYSAFDNKLISI